MLVSMRYLEVILNANIDRNIPTMVHGPAGVGKSSLPKQIAQKRRAAKPKEGWKLIDFRATLRDPVDMRGLPWIDSKSGETRWLPPGELPQAKRDGERGILLLDELPQATDAMQKACFSLVLDRYIGEYYLPPGWVIIAAGNRLQDRSGANRMNKALANRFAHYEVAAEVEPWCAWAADVKLSAMVVAFIRFRPALIHSMPDTDENAFPTPRAWEAVAKHADETDEGLRRLLIGGLVGEDAADQFEAFARTYGQLPPLPDILAGKRGTRVPRPEEMALKYAVATALARHVDKKTFANALDYMGRLDSPEYTVLFMQDATRIKPELKATSTFAKWFADNSDVLI